MVPLISQLHLESSYLRRQIALLAISSVAPLVTIETIRDFFIPILRSLAQDKVGNIRMNTAKSLSAVSKAVTALDENMVGNADVHRAITSLLGSLTKDRDPDV